MIWQSFIVGIVFGGLNFWLLTRIIAGLIHSEKVKRWQTALFFFGKITLLFLTIGLILWKGYVTPLPFLGGFTVSLVMGILLSLWKGRERTHA